MGNGTGVRVDGVPSICFGSVNLSGDCTVHSSTFSTDPFFIYLFFLFSEKVADLSWAVHLVVHFLISSYQFPYSFII